MNKNEVSMMDKIVKFINYIGEAGINEVYYINENNFGNKNSYSLQLEGNLNNGFSYHYYDYEIKLLCTDNRNLTIKTEAVEEDKGFKTIISIIYSLPNNKKYKLTGYINGWKYSSLLNFKKSDAKAILRPEVDEENNLIPAIPKSNRKSLFSIDELNYLLDFLDINMEMAIDKQEEDKKIVDEVLKTLSDDQIVVLKKVLNNGKY